jgi:hypothetical protein
VPTEAVFNFYRYKWKPAFGKVERTEEFIANYKEVDQRVISGFCREVAENCALLGYYAASSGNFLLTFRGNLSVPSSGFKTSVRNYHHSLPNNPEERISIQSYTNVRWAGLRKISEYLSQYCWPGSKIFPLIYEYDSLPLLLEPGWTLEDEENEIP